MSQVAVNGQVWNYLKIGSGKRTPILVLHGWGRSKEEWIRLASELSKIRKCEIYLLDLPGFGGSSLPKVNDIYEYSSLLSDLCKYLEIKKAIIAGHSLGGRVAIVMGSRHSSLVEKLILIDPAGVKPRSIKRVVLTTLAKLTGFVPVAWRRQVMTKMMDMDYQNSPALRDLYRAIVKDDLRHDLGKIVADVTLVWGERDPILPLSLSQIYRRAIPQSTLRVVWGTGHDPHLTHYDQLKRIIEENIE